MANNEYCTYLRVSTTKQGAQGLGIEAQRKMCEDFIRNVKGTHVQEFSDVESGTHRDRKGLWAAVDYCKKNDCELVIAKLDRLARDVEFTFKIINTGIGIHFTDMPMVNTMILGVFASVAQYERELISTRTTLALQAKRERGEAMGAATEAWRESYNAKSDEQRHKDGVKRGATKNRRFMASPNTQALIKVLRSVFPQACESERITEWNWKSINTKRENRIAIFARMKDWHDFDDTIFTKWDFDDVDDKAQQSKLSNTLANLRRAAYTSEIINN